MLLLGSAITRDHGSHSGGETGEPNHRDVHKEKEDDEARDEEMDGSCGLMTAEDIDECGDNGRDGRRHGQTCEDYQRKQHEDHREVGDPLNDVVRQGLFFSGPLEARK